MTKGIDVSHWQGNINFTKVKEQGYDFVIIKAGGSDKGFYTDSKFEQNYEAAVAAGLHVGAYYFAGSKFFGAKSGKADAERFMQILGNKKFDFPVFLDIEAQPTGHKDEITTAAFNFCKTLEAKNWFCGIYASDVSGFVDRINLNDVLPFTLWVARYGNQPQVAKSWGIHQYSSKGAVVGIVGNVDINECRIDYPTTITKRFNNYMKGKTK